jgi:Ca2+:H+ antiporter
MRQSGLVPLQVEASEEAAQSRESRREVRVRAWPGRCPRFGIGPVLFSSRLNVLLVAVPVTFIARLAGAAGGALFALSLVSLVPLASLLGYLTEQLSLRTNQSVGGLLNATFGNATEVIIALFALRHNLFRIIQVSLLGSILSNMLLILGTAFMLGGVRFHQQRFNKEIASMASGLMLLSVMGLLFPAVLNVSDMDTPRGQLDLSRLTAVVLLLVYLCFLFFQLKTHRDLFADDPAEGEELYLRMPEALAWLGGVTVVIAILSEFLVSAIEGAAKDFGIPQIFIGAILLPVVGNATEHVAALTAAYKNKMNMCLGVAIGSSTQIALFCVPFLIVISWFAGKPLDLFFQVYETACVLMSTLIVTFLTAEGRSNWMSGLLLLSTYTLMGAGFYYHKDNAE